MNFTWRISNRKQCLQLYFFQGYQHWYILSCPTRLSALPSLLTAAFESFSLMESVCSHSMDCLAICWESFWLKYFSLHLTLSSVSQKESNKWILHFWCAVCITHSSVNFTWYALLSHQKFDAIALFKPEALCLICCHFEQPQKKYFC